MISPRLSPLKGDATAVALVLALCALCAFIFAPQSAGQTANIYRHGELIHSLPLNEHATVIVSGQYQNTITTGDGNVHFEHSDCPGGDCMLSGRISLAGQSLVCLPNGVTVHITGGVDAVAR